MGIEPRSAHPDGGTNEAQTHHPYSMQEERSVREDRGCGRVGVGVVVTVVVSECC